MVGNDTFEKESTPVEFLKKLLDQRGFSEM